MENLAQPGIIHILDPAWKAWTPDKFTDALHHPIAAAGFKKDMDALIRCDACVLVTPCGRSAHLELGWAVGQGKITAIVLTDGEPELMYRMADRVIASPDGLFDVFGEPSAD